MLISLLKNSSLLEHYAMSSILVKNNATTMISPVALGYWLDIPFVFPRNNWDVATASIFGKLR